MSHLPKLYLLKDDGNIYKWNYRESINNVSSLSTHRRIPSHIYKNYLYKHKKTILMNIKFYDSLLFIQETHVTPKPYKCKEGGKSFNQTSPFTMYHTIHTEEKWFICDICSKFCNPKLNLISHHRSHTGETSFKCNECGKVTSHKQYLIIHVGEKNIQMQWLWQGLQSYFTPCTTQEDSYQRETLQM